MSPAKVLKILLSAISYVADHPEFYFRNPGKDFTRNRILTFKTVVKGIISFGDGNLTNEVQDIFKRPGKAATTSAFVQQRSKINPEAFEKIFRIFCREVSKDYGKKMHILAVDGSDIQIPTDPNDKMSFYPGKNGHKSFNLLHLNALYDLDNRSYVSVVLQKSREGNESRALIEMVDSSSISNALVIADRGYEAYNNLAHIARKGWKFLFRAKNGWGGIGSALDLPEKGDFDIDIALRMSRSNSAIAKLVPKGMRFKYISADTVFDYLPLKKGAKNSTDFYDLKFRIVRFKLPNSSYETVITNLERKKFDKEKLKQLYARRWGIETSFRELKYTVGILNFHSKKEICVRQEIFAALIMYNFSAAIARSVAMPKEKSKYVQKYNFATAVHICKKFLREKANVREILKIIKKSKVPIRPGRHFERGKNRDAKQAKTMFCYKTA